MLSKEHTEPSLRNSSGIQPSFGQNLHILSEDAVEEIHATSLRILANAGVELEHPEALRMLHEHGAKITGTRVCIPEKLVGEAIETAPHQVTLYARDPQYNVTLGRGNVHFTNGFGATWVLDHETNQLHSATVRDLESFTRLVDVLEQVSFCLFSVVPQDVPPHLLDAVSTAIVLQNTRKHVQLSLERAEWLDTAIEIGRTLVEPGQPLPFSAGGVPNSPLRYTKDVLTKFIQLSQNQIPCFIVCGAMAGATAPVTLAGLLAQQNAEFLAGLVVHQVANPGAPAIYGTFSGGFDMRHTKLALGGPEVSLITAATQQLADRYRIPLGYATGGVTDSPSSDIQAGVEKTFGIFAAAASGVDVIHDAVSGLLGSAMVISMPQLLVDHEICTSIAYYLRGIPVTKADLAEELIAEVGPGGSFLTTEATAVNFRKSLYMTPFRARNCTPEEATSSSSHYLESASKKVDQTLARYQPYHVSEKQKARIEAILDRPSP